MNISGEILQVLSACNFSGNKLVLPEQLDRALYTKTNKVIELAGGKWSRKEKGHVFAMNAEDRIDQVILTGQIDAPKDTFNFFPTPPELIERMLKWLNLRKGDRLLEPSCGDGRIALAAAAMTSGLNITAVELDPIRIADLKANSTFTALNSSLVEGDFLTYTPEECFDVIPMNPPFLQQNDIRHVSHAIDLLAPKGRLCAIMSAGVTFRQNRLTVDFRDRVKSLGGKFEEIEPATFKKSGTMVNTVMLKIKL